MNKCFGNTVIVIVALLIAVALAELLSRQFLPPPQTVQYSIKQKTGNVSENKKQLTLQQHPDEGGVYRGTPAGKRLRPNRVITIQNHQLSGKSVTIETNSLGYRNPELGEKNGKRILFLGDSVTFQDYLNEEETFVRLIERKARDEQLNWETINAGVGAISLKTELAILLETGLSVNPDVVVVGFYLNDFQESKGVEVIRLPWLLQKSWFAYHLTQWVHLQQGWITQTSAVDLDQWKKNYLQQLAKEGLSTEEGFFNESPAAFRYMISETFHDYGAAWSEEAWLQITPLFTELKSIADREGFQLVIVGFPVYQQVYSAFIDDYPQQQLKQMGQRLDIPVLNLLPPLRAKALELRDSSIYKGDTLYRDLFYDQCHHTPQGSALIAEEIYRFLKTL